jgi:two-component system, NtrC family, sensor histidine kinase KinB
LIISQQSRTISLVESLGDGIVMFNNEKNVVLLNPAVAKATGLSVEGFTLPDFYKLFPAFEFDRLVEKAITAGEFSHLNEAQLVDQYYEIFITPVHDHEKKIVGGAIIMHNITHLKEVDRMKTEFVSVVSHQLRTPLTAVKLFTEMLLKGDAGKTTTQQKEYLSDIFQSTERMVRLVNDLLNITRIESGRLSITPQLTSVENLIEEVLAEIKPLADMKKIKLKFLSPAEALPKIPLDKNLFRQVVHNLIVNALRYTNAEKGRVVISAAREKGDILIGVEDNGIGIPAKDQANVFNKFFRAGNAAKAATEGTGLGLYVVKMIVEFSNGKIWFKSAENKGTTFFVLIPLAGMKKKEGEPGLVLS